MCIVLGFFSLLICIVTFICIIETLMKEENRIKYILIEFIFTTNIFFFIIEFIDRIINI